MHRDTEKSIRTQNLMKVTDLFTTFLMTNCKCKLIMHRDTRKTYFVKKI